MKVPKRMYTPGRSVTRRGFLIRSAVGGAALLSGTSFGRTAPAVSAGRRPNILFIVTDQQGLDTISAVGCSDVHTPNLDRLARRGMTFMESHSTDPVCSPARSSIFTGRMPSETGVFVNGRPIRESIPNVGQWLSREGYETVYVGKWHLPRSFTLDIPGFTVIPGGLSSHGTVGDGPVSRACQGYLRNYKGDKPFLLVASFLQPHDVCHWVIMRQKQPENLPYPELAGELPPLPSNFDYDPREPERVKQTRQTSKRCPWNEEQWRFYLWSYYRMVEEVDAEIGRVLQALEDAGHLEDTLVVFTSDHGEGRARHQQVLKNVLYDEAVKVPLIFSWPGRISENVQDRTSLVSGLDIVPTLCDFVGVKAPPDMRGRTLRAALEGRAAPGAEFVAAEVRITGRMVRTPDFKYIAFEDDPVVQLFDMKNNPGETKNLFEDSQYASVLEEHRRLLERWESRLDPMPRPAPRGQTRQRPTPAP
ncbi:Delta 4,5-hexuronate-2-O-sulfatase [subsurface metagenome]